MKQQSQWTRRVCRTVTLAACVAGRVGIILAGTILATTAAQAQFGANLQGTVEDSSGAVIAGATITLTNLGTNQVRTATSGDSGFYRISQLPPGNYKVVVNANNFKPATFDNVIVAADTPSSIDAKLALASSTQTVNVSAETAPQLQTADGSVSNTIDERAIERLPTVGRDPYNFVRLTPGISGDGARSGNGQASALPNNSGPGGSNTSIFQSENQVQISSAGQRVSSNTYLIDGVTVDSLGFGGAAVVTPNVEAVQNITVTSSSYSAEDGRNSGAQVKVTTKSGTNQFHGSALFKYDSPSLNAFNRFNGLASGGTLAPQQRVQDNYRDWAGSIGGPIKTDKLFFFLSYEGIKNNTAAFSQQYIGTPQLYASFAQAPGLTGQFFSQPGFQPRVVAYLPFHCSDVFGASYVEPAPGAQGPCRTLAGGLDLGSPTGAQGTYVGTTGGGLDGVPDVAFATINTPSRTRGNQFNGRIDYTLTSRDLIAGSAYFTKLDNSASDPGTGAQPISDVAFKPLNSAITALYIHTFSPSLLNELRGNFTRFAENGIRDNVNVNFGVPRLQVEGYPLPNRPQFGATQSETTPAIFAQNTYEVRDTVSKTINSNSIKFGAEFRFEQDNSAEGGAARPLYSNTGFWNLYNGAPVFEQIDANPVTGGAPNTQRYLRTHDFAGFVQDDWKVNPNLTLNLGLRYEYFSPLGEKNGQLANIANPLQTTLAEGSRLVPESQFFNPNTKNLGPKFGFAFTPPAANGKLVLRGGFGLSYNRLDDVLFANSRANSGFFRYGICCGTAATPYAGGQITYVGGATNSPTSFPANPALQQPIDPQTGTPLNNQVEVYGAFAHTPEPYSYLYSFEVQSQLPSKLVLTIGYQGSDNFHYTRIVDECLTVGCNPSPLNPTDRRLYTAVFVPTNDVYGNYNGVNVHLSRQYASGFQFDANYTYSKSLDELSSEGPGAQTNQTDPSNPRSEYGPSDYDNTHRIYGQGTWDLPWLQHNHGPVGILLGHFQFSGIITAHSGFPWTPLVGFANSFNQLTDSISPSRPIRLLHKPGTDYSNAAFRTGKNFINPNTGKVDGTYYFSTQQPSGPGDYQPGVGRNSLRGPRYFDTDLSLAKNLPFNLRDHAVNVNLRLNSFNLFNRENVAPFAFNTNSTNVQNGLFGQGIGGLAGRVLELQGRMTF
jgi:Carboxypeptidase regulatory-like domain